jgi:hypothetical protein
MITFLTPEQNKEIKTNGEVLVLPVKTSLHEYYSGGPLRLSTTDKNDQHHQVLFDNPMVLFEVDPASITAVSKEWTLDWEMCWWPPVITQQPNSKWTVKYHQFVQERIEADIDNFARAVLFAIYIGEDAE